MAGSIAWAADQYKTANAAAGKDKLETQLVRTGLYMVSGGGANSLFRLSSSGVIVVDGKRPGNYDGLISQVRIVTKMSELPVRVLIDTDHHEDHVGNNAAFRAAGAGIIAHENTARLLAASRSGDLSGTPTLTFSDRYNIRLGGIEVQLFHFGPAHTSGDTVVYFSNLKVVAVGEIYSPDGPDPDFAAGGTLSGLPSVLNEILKLDFDIAVPSRGPMITRADLQEYKAKVETILARAKTLVKNGLPKDQLFTRLRTDGLGWQVNYTGERLEQFYADVSRTN